MTEEAKALVERLRYTEEHGIFTAHDNGMQAMPGEAADLIETQAAEIERLRALLSEAVDELEEWRRREYDPLDTWPIIDAIRAALGASHD